MDEWLGANLGSSRCCSVCGKSECRTVEVGGTTFEAIPEKLIIRAALAAASTMFDATKRTSQLDKGSRLTNGSYITH
jgi:hypothetical protein